MPLRYHARSTILRQGGGGCHQIDTKSNPKCQETDTKSQSKAASSVDTYIYKIKLLVFFGVFVCFYLFFLIFFSFVFKHLSTTSAFLSIFFHFWASQSFLDML